MKNIVESREAIKRTIEREWRRFCEEHPDLDIRDNCAAARTGPPRRRPERIGGRTFLPSLAAA